MIGNDIVDLDLSRKQSNWKRKGFLDKIFTVEEQKIILNDCNPELMVWNLWSRKEAAYKIYNRMTGVKGYFPWLLQCSLENQYSGSVLIDDCIFYTQTEITTNYIYSIAVSEIVLFANINCLDSIKNVKKNNRIPYIIDEKTNEVRPVSITHHGRFQRIITV